MKFEQIKGIVGEVPCIRPDKGKIIYEFIQSSGLKNILELGFAHGTSTCYMAAALDESKAGQITTIDVESARYRKPNINDLLEETQLSNYVSPIFSHTSYNWELMKIIQDNTIKGVCHPIFDFCFIDGAHTWEVDGLAFFLVEKLLKPGGWILFDDIHWSYSTSPSLKNQAGIKKMPQDYQEIAQVERVFSLLTSQHPNFGNFKLNDDWGWAQKKVINELKDSSNDLVDQIYLQQGVKQDLISITRKIRRRINL